MRFVLTEGWLAIHNLGKTNQTAQEQTQPIKGSKLAYSPTHLLTYSLGCMHFVLTEDRLVPMNLKKNKKNDPGGSQTHKRK